MQENVIDFFNVEAEKLYEALGEYSGAFSKVSKKLEEQNIKCSRPMVGMVLSGVRIAKTDPTRAKYSKIFEVARQVGFEMQMEARKYTGKLIATRVQRKKKEVQNFTPLLFSTA